jgi:hypothetical protein
MKEHTAIHAVVSFEVADDYTCGKNCQWKDLGAKVRDGINDRDGYCELHGSNLNENDEHRLVVCGECANMFKRFLGSNGLITFPIPEEKDV